jgi:hypothetical protein
MLALTGGDAVHVGERASTVAGKIPPAWQVRPDAVERTASGERITRIYDDGSRLFVLVIDRPSGEPDARVVAIYLQPR